VLAVGTRLQDFTTGSWSVFQNPEFRLVALNAARFDAHKHRALAVVGDARAGLAELSAALGDWRASETWRRRAEQETAQWNRTVEQHSGPTNVTLPSYAHVVGAINRKATREIVVTAAGGLPGELSKNWRVKAADSFDCEFGFSCMGYEIAGGWGLKMAHPERDVVVFVGDGSYLMMNSDIYSTVLTGHKLIVVVCDNGGYAVIDRLQNFKGGTSFNNLFEHCRGVRQVGVDFAGHARSLGALAERVTSIVELEQAFERAKAADRTYLIEIKVSATQWTPGDAWWDVGVPQVSARESVRDAAAQHAADKKKQRIGV
jgi:3D-(3,5/4)-trihydroxycyclohexane-1,2-dione acylhydrolase (decyclizing)